MDFEGEYVSYERINDLRRITYLNTKKLVRLCEELNQAYRSKCWYTVGILNRAIIDHVPPVWDQKNFVSVVNNMPFSKSTKKSLENLEKFSRNIADQIIHGQMKIDEEITIKQTVNYSSPIDILLQEVISKGKIK